MKKEQSVKAIFVGSICSDKVFYDIFDNSSSDKPNIAGQRFERMIAIGLNNAGLDIDILTIPPTTPSYYRVISQFQDDTIKDIQINYIPDVNLKFIKQVWRSIFFLFFIIKWLTANRKSERVIISGSIYPPILLPCILLKKIFSFTSVVLVPDIPKHCYSVDIDKSKNSSKFRFIFLSIFVKISDLISNKYDAYIVLSTEMSNLINTKKKPFIVIECMIETELSLLENSIENKYFPPAIMYAGGIYKKYGIILLLDSIKNISNTPFELWIFGSGDDIDLVEKESENDIRIKYFGSVKHSILMTYQAKATIMINPRPAGQDFTKYSFPSKTIEYMASGTPLVSTRIESIPSDFDKHIIYIDEQTPEMIGMLLENTLRTDKSILHQKGMEAREFALHNKNYIVQTKKIYDFIFDIL